MRTRKSYYPNNSSVTILRRRNKRRAPNLVEPKLRTIVEIAPMADNRTIEELLQAPTEGYGEAIAWERFKEMLRACFHHGFMKLTQIDTFYNGLNENDQDSLNAAAGENLLSKTTREALNIIENKSKVRYSRYKPNVSRMNTNSMENASKTDDRIDKLADQILTLVDIFAKKVVTPAMIKAVEESCVTCGANPRVPLILVRSFLRTGRALIDVYREEITIRVNDEADTFNINQTTRYSSTYDDMSVNQLMSLTLLERKKYAQEMLGFSKNSLGGNPTLTSGPIISDSSPSLTSFEGSDFILKEIKAYLKDESISPKTDHADCDPKGDICLIENLLNDDPFQLPLMDLKQRELNKAKSLIKEPPELELKDLPSHLEYAYLEGADNLPVIIAKKIKNDEKEALLKVLKSHKRAIAWKIIDIKGIDPHFCTYKILMEKDYKPAVQIQRRVYPKINVVIKKEVIKFLDAGMIYPIFDSLWVSLVHCVPKKGGITVVENENNELIHTRLVTVNPQDQEKTTFTCPYGTFAYRRIHFGLYNAPGTFQRLGVDRAKVDVIAKLPHPTKVKGVRSFLGHAGFYRRFIQDFSKIAITMTYLLEIKTSFVFSKYCIDAFETLKKKLAEARILVVPD
nr:reverse transcriptase domain-containing protein [Tanacetum cinerariifolium]